jgi:hypothetical protein
MTNLSPTAQPGARPEPVAVGTVLRVHPRQVQPDRAVADGDLKRKPSLPERVGERADGGLVDAQQHARQARDSAGQSDRIDQGPPGVLRRRDHDGPALPLAVEKEVVDHVARVVFADVDDRRVADAPRFDVRPVPPQHPADDARRPDSRPHLVARRPAAPAPVPDAGAGAAVTELDDVVPELARDLFVAVDQVQQEDSVAAPRAQPGIVVADEVVPVEELTQRPSWADAGGHPRVRGLAESADPQRPLEVDIAGGLELDPVHDEVTIECGSHR